MSLDQLAPEILLAVMTLAGTWGVVKSQLSDLRVSNTETVKGLQEVRLKVATLEAQHDGLGQRLDEALGKLEQVTQDLQQVALQIARSSR